MSLQENLEQEISVDNTIHYLTEIGYISLEQNINLRQCERDEEKVELLNNYLNL